MGRRQMLLLSLAALMLCTVSADALRQLQQSEVKVCRYACGMGMSCINGVCRASSVNDLSSDSPAMSAEAASPAPSDSAPLVRAQQSVLKTCNGQNHEVHVWTGPLLFIVSSAATHNPLPLKASLLKVADALGVEQAERMPSDAAAQMSPVPLESNSDVGSPQSGLNAEQAASMSFIDTSADTSTIAPSNSPEPGEHSCPMVITAFHKVFGTLVQAATVPMVYGVRSILQSAHHTHDCCYNVVGPSCLDQLFQDCQMWKRALGHGMS